MRTARSPLGLHQRSAGNAFGTKAALCTRLHRRPRGLVCFAKTAGVAQPVASDVPWYDEHRSLPSYRAVYDFDFWTAHRTPFRYFIRLFRTKESSVLRNVLPAVAFVAYIACCVGVYAQACAAGAMPGWMPTIEQLAPFAQAFTSTTSIAMSLLLVFRTNQSYNRFDEARKFWGATLNRSRDVIRQCVSLFPANEEYSREAFGRWLVAFVKAMHRHFQNEGSLEEDLKFVLPKKELDMLLKAQHRPMMALHVLSELVQQSDMHPIHQQQMSLNLQHFHDQLGACERLLRTPIPLSYTRHTSRLLFGWLMLLPFALWPVNGWLTVPLVALIAGALLKIDEIGVQIEEPFSILPLDVIARRIATDVNSTLADSSTVKWRVWSMARFKPSVSEFYDSEENVSSYSNGNGKKSMAFVNGRSANGYRPSKSSAEGILANFAADAQDEAYRQQTLSQRLKLILGALPGVSPLTPPVNEESAAAQAAILALYASYRQRFLGWATPADGFRCTEPTPAKDLLEDSARVQDKHFREALLSQRWRATITKYGAFADQYAGGHSHGGHSAEEGHAEQHEHAGNGAEHASAGSASHKSAPSSGQNGASSNGTARKATGETGPQDEAKRARVREWQTKLRELVASKEEPAGSVTPQFQYPSSTGERELVTVQPRRYSQAFETGAAADGEHNWELEKKKRLSKIGSWRDNY